MPTGIKYIKVAKIDASGNDRSDALEQMKTLRLTFTDLGLVAFQVTDRVEYTNYYQFTVNPIEPLPGGAITSSDNRVYNYTSSIPSQPLTDTLLSGSLTQAKEISSRGGQLALSGSFSNWDKGSNDGDIIYLPELSGSTIYGEFQGAPAAGPEEYGYSPSAAQGGNPSYDYTNIVGVNVSQSRSR